MAAALGVADLLEGRGNSARTEVAERRAGAWPENLRHSVEAVSGGVVIGIGLNVNMETHGAH